MRGRWEKMQVPSAHKSRREEEREREREREK